MDVSVFLGEESRHGLATIKEEDHPEVVLYCMYGKRSEVLEHVAWFMVSGLIVAAVFMGIGFWTVGIENVVFYVLIGVGVFVFLVLTAYAIWSRRRKTVQTFEPKEQKEWNPNGGGFNAPDGSVAAKSLDRRHDSDPDIPGMDRLRNGP